MHGWTCHRVIRRGMYTGAMMARCWIFFDLQHQGLSHWEAVAAVVYLGDPMSLGSPWLAFSAGENSAMSAVWALNILRRLGGRFIDCVCYQPKGGCWEDGGAPTPCRMQWSCFPAVIRPVGQGRKEQREWPIRKLQPLFSLELNWKDVT